ncbi:AidA/PixA family protein [Flavobacterium sp. ENC]|uniref:AidA/PixA family protein n=1 Tax=Flavobacterium sp. ENC TaxID=2897330 RepID=UPI001E30E21C|nr:AidA/PixA family protein [Flavobacterium sp. ENC]MCD0466895.1 inclusion body family protein [Flavobacterium sp. ENC]
MSNLQINIVVETSLLLEEHLNVSMDIHNPAPLSNEYACLVITGQQEKIKGLKKNKVSVERTSVEELSFNVVSVSGNFDNPVVLYDFTVSEGNDILEPLSIFSTETDTIVPERFDPLETAVVKRVFSTNKCAVRTSGKGCFGVRFVVFDDDLAIAGYFEFPVLLSVK